MIKLFILRLYQKYSYILSHMRSLLSHNWIFCILKCLGMWKDAKFGDDEIIAPPSGMSITRPKRLSNSTSSATLQQFFSVLWFTLSVNLCFPVFSLALLDIKQNWVLRNVICTYLYLKTYLYLFTENIKFYYHVC